MKSLQNPNPEKAEKQPMKRFVIRSAEAVQTTRATVYGMCCCSIPAPTC